MDTVEKFFNTCYPGVKNAWENPHGLEADDFDVKAVEAFSKLTRGEQTEVLRGAMAKWLAYRKSNTMAGKRNAALRELASDPDALRVMAAKGIDVSIFQKRR